MPIPRNNIRKHAPSSLRKLSPQAWRTLRRRALERQTPLERQIARGRPDTELNWCGKPSCPPEKFIYETPMHYFTDKIISKNGLSVITYHRDFVKSMVENVFPDLIDFTPKAAKLKAILSYKLTRKDLHHKLMEAKPIFDDLMFGPKTDERILKAHNYISPLTKRAINGFKDVALQFLIRAELWRRHETCRSAAWTMGTPEQVAQFQTALLCNYWYMWWDGCFREMNPYFDGSWDRIWDQWLDEYPVSERHDAGDDDGRVLIVRQELEATEEELFEHVGYLGGLGQVNDVHKPVRDRPARR